MNPWTVTTLAQLDDSEADRYAAYVNQRLDRFHEYDDENKPLPADEFAAQAWTIATTPEGPGYVRLRPDLLDVRPYFDDDDGALYLSLRLPIRHSAVRTRIPFGPDVTDWDRHTLRHDGWTTPLPPRPGTRTALLFSAELRISAASWPLYVPTTTRGPGLLRDTAAAVRILVDHLNQDAAPLTANLTP
ncbi:hypothetical protein ACIPRL_08080 [Streptomyces sp. NPDC090085]|uniref:hypothetical protein n=1 Tax=Streptomyces sp. NPDC090085 TaxID=3365943 RepID=UPI0038062FE1